MTKKKGRFFVISSMDNTSEIVDLDHIVGLTVVSEYKGDQGYTDKAECWTNHVSFHLTSGHIIKSALNQDGYDELLSVLI